MTGFLPTPFDIRYLTRTEWGANTQLPRLGYTVPTNRRTEIWVHHTAAIDSSDTTPNRWGLADAIKYMRRLQTVRPDLGLDVPYTETYADLEDGTVAVFEGRGLSRTGAHTKNHNTAGFGLSGMGNFQLSGSAPAAATVATAMTARVGWLKHEGGYDGLTKVGGHRDLKATTCPGNNLYNHIGAIAEALGDDMADPRLTDEETDTLIAIHKALKSRGSNGGFAGPAVDMIRDFRGRTADSLEESADIVDVEARLRELIIQTIPTEFLNVEAVINEIVSRLSSP